MSRFTLVAASLCGLIIATTACAAKPKTEDDKAFYALGLALSQNLTRYNLSAKELAMVQAGIKDAITGKEPVVTLEEYGPKLSELVRARAEIAKEAEVTHSAKMLEEMRAADGAEVTDSGLIYFAVEEGSGAHPAASDTVTVHYTGTLRDGSVFDSSVNRGEPASFPLNRVIPCWTEGLQKMKVGGKARLVCPSDIAYGERGSPPRILPGAALVFEVELLDIQSANQGG